MPFGKLDRPNHFLAEPISRNAPEIFRSKGAVSDLPVCVLSRCQRGDELARLVVPMNEAKRTVIDP